MKFAAGKYFFTRESEVCGEKIFFFEVSGKKKIFPECRAAAPPANIVPPSFCFCSSAPPPHQSALPPRLRQAQRRRRRSPARKELTIAVSVHGGRTKLGTATGMTPRRETRPRRRRTTVLRWRGSEIGLSECEITLCRFLKKFRAVGSFSKV